MKMQLKTLKRNGINLSCQYFILLFSHKLCHLVCDIHVIPTPIGHRWPWLIRMLKRQSMSSASKFTGWAAKPSECKLQKHWYEYMALGQRSGDQFLQLAILHWFSFVSHRPSSSGENCRKLEAKTQTSKTHLSSSEWRSDLFIHFYSFYFHLFYGGICANCHLLEKAVGPEPFRTLGNFSLVPPPPPWNFQRTSMQGMDIFDTTQW